MSTAIAGVGASMSAPPPPSPTDEAARTLLAQNTRFGAVDVKAVAQGVAAAPGDKAALSAAVARGLDPQDQATLVSELTVIAKRPAPAAAPPSDDRPHGLLDHLKDAGGVLWGAAKDVGHLAVNVGQTASDLTLGGAVDAARHVAGLATGHTPEAPSWAPSAERGVRSLESAGKTAWTAATHPGAVLDALKAPYQKDVAEGRWGALAAQTVLDFGGLLDGESEALVGARVAAKSGEIAADVSKVADVSKAVDVSKAADLSKAADAAKAAPAVADLARSSATIGKTTVEWSRNAEGVTVHTEADLKQVYDSIPRSSAETKAQKAAADLGVTGDQGGHIIGHRFVKDQGGINMFPQNGNLNMGAYKTFENEVADWIKAGGEVRAKVDLVGPGERPTKINVSYEVLNAKGTPVYDNAVSFRNQAGQSFDRIAAGDMTKLLNP